ncbi:Protein transport protein sec31 [Zancudomyces culisetae]|uniref:Protein transport protein sec31 n=1 Tax=Zancudomyces culisetae TaxID=1213189 RepID=A0A1R1PCJ1_ZANCU|nr:Protein transport protein sec31 [Zancudomyces culisetae]|eukprot:OMH78695.1 Protein transport protein sec31 [Zancudomyces culisetae]
MNQTEDNQCQNSELAFTTPTITPAKLASPNQAINGGYFNFTGTDHASDRVVASSRPQQGSSVLKHNSRALPSYINSGASTESNGERKAELNGSSPTIGTTLNGPPITLQKKQEPPTVNFQALSNLLPQQETNKNSSVSPVNKDTLSPERILEVFYSVLNETPQETPIQKKTVQDTRKRIEILEQRIKDLDPSLVSSLSSIAQEIQSQNHEGAISIHKKTMLNTFEGESKWLLGLKRVIDLSKKI